MKKVVILGNSWHGNWSYSLFRALTKNSDISVQHIDVRPRHIRTGIFHIDSYIQKISLIVINKKIRCSVLENSYYIVITPHTISKETYDILKQKNITLIAWLGDDPFRKGKASMYLPFFDHIFVVDRSWIQKIESFNPNVSCLPHAFSQSTFFPIQNMPKKYDVVFVGDSFQGTGDGLYRANLLKALYENGISITLFGDKGWLSLSKERPYLFLKTIYQGSIKQGEALNEVYNQSRIVLNIHHRQVQDGANQRIFEASGSFAFQISDRQNLIQDIFTGSIPLYSDEKELVQKVRYFLENEHERLEKAKHAHQKVQEHTYDKRAYTLLNFK